MDTLSFLHDLHFVIAETAPVDFDDAKDIIKLTSDPQICGVYTSVKKAIAAVERKDCQSMGKKYPFIMIIELPANILFETIIETLQNGIDVKKVKAIYAYKITAGYVQLYKSGDKLWEKTEQNT